VSATQPAPSCPHLQQDPLWDGLLGRCRSCGLVVTRRVPEFDYDETYFVEDGSGYDFDSVFAQAFDGTRFENELRELEAAGLRGSVLDVGCAVGTFLRIAKRRGWEVAGVELAEFARKEASRRLGIDVAGSLDALPAGRRYDVVTLHHVLEHIHDPAGFLARDVAPRVGRHLLVEVPNFASLAARTEGLRWKDLRPEQHVQHFEPATLRRAVEAAGFETLRVRTLCDPLWSLRAGQRMLASLRALAGPVPHAGPPPPPGACDGDAAAWRPPTGLRRSVTEASRIAFLPLARWIERSGRAERLVIEARPAPRR